MKKNIIVVLFRPIRKEMTAPSKIRFSFLPICKTQYGTQASLLAK